MRVSDTRTAWRSPLPTISETASNSVRTPGTSVESVLSAGYSRTSTTPLSHAGNCRLEELEIGPREGARAFWGGAIIFGLFGVANTCYWALGLPVGEGGQPVPRWAVIAPWIGVGIATFVCVHLGAVIRIRREDDVLIVERFFRSWRIGRKVFKIVQIIEFRCSEDRGDEGVKSWGVEATTKRWPQQVVIVPPHHSEELASQIQGKLSQMCGLSDPTDVNAQQ